MESLSDGQHFGGKMPSNNDLSISKSNVQDVLAGVRGLQATHRAARGPDQGAAHPRAGQRLPPQLLQGE